MIRYECDFCGELADAELQICPGGCIRPTWTQLVLDEAVAPDEPERMSKVAPGPELLADSDVGQADGALEPAAASVACERCGGRSPAGSERCSVCGVGFPTSAGPAVSGIVVPPPAVNPTGLLVGLLGRPDVPAVAVPAGGVVEIGRAAGPFAPYLQNFGNVSRVHAELRLDVAECIVRDLDSTNGTYFVDAARIVRLSANHWHTVVEGRRLQLGNRQDFPNATLEFIWGVTP